MKWLYMRKCNLSNSLNAYIKFYSYLIPGAVIAFEHKALTGQAFMILSSNFDTFRFGPQIDGS